MATLEQLRNRFAANRTEPTPAHTPAPAMAEAAREVDRPKPIEVDDREVEVTEDELGVTALRKPVPSTADVDVCSSCGKMKKLCRCFAKKVSVGTVLAYKRLEYTGKTDKTDDSDKYWEIMVVELCPTLSHKGKFGLYRHYGRGAATPHLADKHGRWELVRGFNDQSMAMSAMRRGLAEKHTSRPYYTEVKPAF